jgi:hypothetical protein
MTNGMGAASPFGFGIPSTPNIMHNLQLQSDLDDRMYARKTSMNFPQQYHPTTGALNQSTSGSSGASNVMQSPLIGGSSPILSGLAFNVHIYFFLSYTSLIGCRNGE